MQEMPIDVQRPSGTSSTRYVGAGKGRASVRGLRRTKSKRIRVRSCQGHQGTRRIGMRGRPTTAIRAEIDKCDIVCRCCHRVRSLTTKWKPAISEKRANAHIKYRNHAFVTSEKLKRGHCDACSRPVKSANHAETCQFDFDHIDRKTKAFNISKAVKCGYSLERITGELRKCRLLCANCHLIHTRQQLGFRTYREPQPR